MTSAAIGSGEPAPVSPCTEEPSLATLLADPVTRAVMAADGVDPAELATTLTGIGRMLALKQPAQSA